MARSGRFGWFLGLLFGAVFGVLFAPRTGKDLRSKIKADVKKGGLGVGPLKSDMKEVGGELAQIAKEIYKSEAVQDFVGTGKEKAKDFSKDFLHGFTDFHTSKIKPAKKKLEKQIKFVKHEISRGGKKVRRSVKIGKSAVKSIKKELKKK